MHFSFLAVKVSVFDDLAAKLYKIGSFIQRKGATIINCKVNWLSTTTFGLHKKLLDSP